jgi:hypothetical protein
MASPSGTHAIQSGPTPGASKTAEPAEAKAGWEGLGAVLPLSGMLRWSAVFAVSAVVLGCGPSLRRVQQSRVYFERCYAADFDPRIPLAEKHACWTAWREHYTIGQPPDRTDYALQRIRAIEHGESVPRLPGLPEAALGPRRATPIMAVSAPQEPPEVQEPPPASADEERLTARERRRRRRHRAPLPRTTNPSCATTACEPAFRSCTEACPEHGEGEACRTACEVELHSCARGCF